MLLDKLEIIQNLQIVSQRCSMEAVCKQNVYESLGLMSYCALTAFLKILPSRQGVAGTCLQAGKMKTGRNETPETSAHAAVGNWSCGIYICGPTWLLLDCKSHTPSPCCLKRMGSLLNWPMPSRHVVLVASTKLSSLAYTNQQLSSSVVLFIMSKIFRILPSILWELWLYSTKEPPLPVLQLISRCSSGNGQ